jgi:hypothetical protein
MKKLSEETKSTIKLFAAILIVIFVFKILSGDQSYTYTEEEIDAAFDKLVKVSEETSEESEYQEDLEETEKVDEFAHLRAKRVELSAGYHNVGNDGKINPGTYRVYAKEGYGLITGDLYQGYISETVGYSGHIGYTEEIDEIYLSKEDSFKIEGRCVLVFEPIE